MRETSAAPNTEPKVPMDLPLLNAAAHYLYVAENHLCAGTKKWEAAILLALCDMIRKQTTPQ